jgi:hypothetical protein
MNKIIIIKDNTTIFFGKHLYVLNDHNLDCPKVLSDDLAASIGERIELCTLFVKNLILISRPSSSYKLART